HGLETTRRYVRGPTTGRPPRGGAFSIRRASGPSLHLRSHDRRSAWWQYPVIRHVYNLESVFTYGGTNEIYTLAIGEAITGSPAYRWQLGRGFVQPCLHCATRMAWSSQLRATNASPDGRPF